MKTSKNCLKIKFSEWILLEKVKISLKFWGLRPQTPILLQFLKLFMIFMKNSARFSWENAIFQKKNEKIQWNLAKNANFQLKNVKFWWILAKLMKILSIFDVKLLKFPLIFLNFGGLRPPNPRMGTIGKKFFKKVFPPPPNQNPGYATDNWKFDYNLYKIALIFLNTEHEMHNIGKNFV